MRDERRIRLWMALSDLFLDGEADVEAIAREIRATGYSEEEVTRCLREEVGPVAGANLGYGLYPVIGVWGMFDEAWLCASIEAWLARPRWFRRIGEALGSRVVAEDFRRVAKIAFH